MMQWKGQVSSLRVAQSTAVTEADTYPDGKHTTTPAGVKRIAAEHSLLYSNCKAALRKALALNMEASEYCSPADRLAAVFCTG